MPESLRIAVIGSTGCGGRAAVSALRAAGHEILGIARGQSNGPAPDFICDRRDTDRIQRRLAQFQPQTVIDQVAYSPDDVSSLIEALPGSTCRYLFVSSSVVYGPGGGRPYRESDAPKPTGLFAESKLAAESTALQWAGNGRDAISLRLGGLYGPGHAPLTPFGRDPVLPQRLSAQETIPIPADDQPLLQPWFAADHGALIRDLVSQPVLPTLLNVAGDERFSWQTFMTTWSLTCGVPAPRFEYCSDEEIKTRAPAALQPFLDALLRPPVMDLDRLQRLMLGNLPATPLMDGCKQVLSRIAVTP
jgi:nucleoside-diphosphate-sugar epimerase